MAKKKTPPKPPPSQVTEATADGNRAKQKKQLRREKRAAERREQRTRQTLTVIGIVVGLAALVWVGQWLLNTYNQSRAVIDARLFDDPAIGPASAPVQLVEFSDFNCPSCRQWHNMGVVEAMVERYGDQFRFIWRDYPIITPDSPRAAQAAQCAYDQGDDAFWAYHDYLYEQASSYTANALKRYAAEVGLDTEAFNTCLDSERHVATVEHDMRDARSYLFQGTPSFVLNGQPLIGPPDADYLAELIDEILAGKR